MPSPLTGTLPDSGPGSPGTNTSTGTMPGAAAWIAAWLIIIVLLWGMSKLSWGKPIVYYTLWLMVVFILVTHSDWLQSIFTQGNITQGNV